MIANLSPALVRVLVHSIVISMSFNLSPALDRVLVQFIIAIHQFQLASRIGCALVENNHCHLRCSSFVLYMIVSWIIWHFTACSQSLFKLAGAFPVPPLRNTLDTAEVLFLVFLSHADPRRHLGVEVPLPNCKFFAGIGLKYEKQS